MDGHWLRGGTIALGSGWVGILVDNTVSTLRAKTATSCPGAYHNRERSQKARRTKKREKLMNKMQVGLKEATASFKKGDMGAREYHDSVLTLAFGDKLPEMMPKILKALPADRAAALRAVSQVRWYRISADRAFGACHLRACQMQRSRELFRRRRPSRSDVEVDGDGDVEGCHERQRRFFPK